LSVAFHSYPVLEKQELEGSQFDADDDDKHRDNNDGQSRNEEKEFRAALNARRATRKSYFNGCGVRPQN
jgi:hypothetical protein